MNWAQLTLKQVEKRSEVITSYKNYIWFNRYISASNQPWHASAGSPMGFLGEFSGDASLVRSDGWSDWAECTRATKRWSAAGSTASWPFGNNSPISYLPIPSTLYSSRKGKVESRNQGNHYYHIQCGSLGLYVSLIMMSIMFKLFITYCQKGFHAFMLS